VRGGEGDEGRSLEKEGLGHAVDRKRYLMLCTSRNIRGSFEGGVDMFACHSSP